MCVHTWRFYEARSAALKINNSGARLQSRSANAHIRFVCFAAFRTLYSLTRGAPYYIRFKGKVCARYDKPHFPNFAALRTMQSKISQIIKRRVKNDADQNAKNVIVCETN